MKDAKDILTNENIKPLLRHPELDKAQLTYADIKHLVAKYRHQADINHIKIGQSHLGNPINMFSMGTGDIKILAWSQMHGDESTATSVIFDLIDLLHSNEFQMDWKKNLTLHFIPMLNPDGAAQGTRRNAQDLDINRDALKQETPEGQLLLNTIKQIRPDLALNLHDQEEHYRCGDTDLPVTLALLAPPYDDQKSINQARKNSMAYAGYMSQIASQYVPQNIAQFSDAFGENCFGDHCAGLDISTILVESGSYPNDPNRQIARSMNTLMILNILTSLIDGKFEQSENINHYLDAYNKLPQNRATQKKLKGHQIE